MPRHCRRDFLGLDPSRSSWRIPLHALFVPEAGHAYIPMYTRMHGEFVDVWTIHIHIQPDIRVRK